jgi:hypothetical protein
MTSPDLLDRDEAIGRAIALLRTAFGPELRDPSAGEVVINHPLVAEHDNAWAVPFNSKSFIEDGDPTHAMIPSLVVVPKDGASAHYAPTGMPVADYLADVSSGSRPWKRPPSPRDGA